MRRLVLSSVCVALGASAASAQPGRTFSPPPPPPPVYNPPRIQTFNPPPVTTFSPPPRIQTFNPPTQNFNANAGIQAAQAANQRAQQLQNQLRSNDFHNQMFRSQQESMRQAQRVGESERLRRSEESQRSQTQMNLESERLRRMTQSGGGGWRPNAIAPPAGVVPRVPNPAGVPVAINRDEPPALIVFVTAVAADSVAADIGLRKGDVLVSYAGKVLQNAQQFADLVQRHAGGGGVELVVARGDGALQFDIPSGKVGVTLRVRRPGEP